MERQYKHRILGILVIIGLVIISLPLFQDGKELSTQVSTIKTPPFPDQPLQFEAAISDAAPQPPRPEVEAVKTQAANEVKPATDMMNTANVVNAVESHPDTPMKTAGLKQSTKSVREIQSTHKTVTKDKGLMNVNSAAWVLQIGSYKNKTNALRVVNQLRANGYHAFLQQMNTVLGNHTRVLIGPEYKRTTAKALANRLRSEMHIQAIVVSYKPLAL